MVINYNEFAEIFNKKLFENGFGDLIKKISDNPDRYIGLFRPTKPRTKLIQNITQSHEIRFGDALEFIFEEYLRREGCTILNKIIEDNDGKTYSIDQLFEYNGQIILIEQKVRDDHDSTKKVGQFQNFEDKYFLVSEIHPHKKVTPIMWFIDDSLTKNKSFYSQKMSALKSDYNCDAYLFYGKQLFEDEKGGLKFLRHIWEEIIDNLKIWKENLPDMPEVNLDKNSEQAFSEICDMTPSIWRKILENEEIITQIFPILFPEKRVLKMLECYYQNKPFQIYRTLASKIRKATELY